MVSPQHVLLAALLAVPALAANPEKILLWPNGAPGSEGATGEETVRQQNADHVIGNVHKPSITAYLPAKDKATGVAVVLAPGGGHNSLWVDHEGHNEAKWLSEHGVAAFVLYYRLAREKDSKYTIEGHALADMMRAIRLVKSRAIEWNINPERVGVMGFSAGGELAALASVRFENSLDNPNDPIDKISSKPAFQGLIYPAIPKDMKLSKDTPPAFMVCGENDRQNISQGLPELYLALKKAGASAELHVYTKVGHGFGMRDTLKGPVSQWLNSFYGFLETLK